MSQGKGEMNAEKNFTSSLISAIATLEYTLTREEVEEKAKQLSLVFNYQGSLDNPVQEAMYSIDSKMGLGVSLVDTEADHDQDWVFKRDNLNWFYSDAYEKFLKSEKWAPNVVQSLSDVGTKILGHLQNPLSEGKWDRRGLVIGHVQSGKTANYLGLTAKAADAGYKFIVVIAGIHNNLRKQTQERVDEGFIGRSSDPEKRDIIGVGYRGYPHPVPLTTIYDDFKKATAKASGWRINDFSKPVILVIKKNVSTLNSLFDWLKDLNAEGNGQISDVPMLMIDDEADNASINTNKEDLDPTKTNAKIREILGLFDKSCYVGYTATPFANIFINSEIDDELFPRDFIYSLDPPTTYFGPDKVFLDDDTSDRILEPIDDAENYIPFKHKKDLELVDLPDSLYKAIRQFVLVKAMRSLGGQANKHCSMMVNVSRFVDVQNSVRTFINMDLKKLREAVKANYEMPESTSQKNSQMISLKQEFDYQFSDCGFTWVEVKVELYKALDSIRTFVVNSKSDETLDYKKYSDEGGSLTAIAVGGLSLSRGLTIEGLCVSYMYRNTRMYDTLMQMGRWFGYRPGFEDLCRVHLSQDSINWYGHIAQSADDLREQIKQMRQDNLSPRKFGLYVKSHPDQLSVTAMNKMRDGEKVKIRQNFSGKIVESFILSLDKSINTDNNDLVKECWSSGFGLGADVLESTNKGFILRDVDTREVDSFLSRFRVHPDFVDRKSAAIAYLRSISNLYPKADVLLISPKQSVKRNQFELVPQIRESATIKEKSWRLSKDRVASRADEKIGLSKEQVSQAHIHAEDSGKNPSDFHYRQVRKKPLLMIHSLDLGDGEDQQKNTPAFGISYPDGDYSEGVEVVANSVWLTNLKGGSHDLPEEDDDE